MCRAARESICVEIVKQSVATREEGVYGYYEVIIGGVVGEEWEKNLVGCKIYFEILIIYSNHLYSSYYNKWHT